MAQDLRGLVTGQFGVTFYVDSDAQPLVLMEDIRGGIAAYTTAERDGLDGRRVAEHMIIFNTTTNQYERLVGGSRNNAGFHTGGTWEALTFQFLASANHVGSFETKADRNASSGPWSTGDAAIVRGARRLARFSTVATAINLGSPANSIFVYGVPADEIGGLQTTRNIALDSAGTALAEVVAVDTTRRTRNVTGVGDRDGYNVTLSSVDTRWGSVNEFFYEFERFGEFRGTYLYDSDETNVDGPTQDADWVLELDNHASTNIFGRFYNGLVPAYGDINGLEDFYLAANGEWHHISTEVLANQTYTIRNGSGNDSDKTYLRERDSDGSLRDTLIYETDEATIERFGDSDRGLRIKDLGVSTAKIANSAVTAVKIDPAVAGRGLTKSATALNITPTVQDYPLTILVSYQLLQGYIYAFQGNHYVYAGTDFTLTNSNYFTPLTAPAANPFYLLADDSEIYARLDSEAEFLWTHRNLTRGTVNADNQLAAPGSNITGTGNYTAIGIQNTAGGNNSVVMGNNNTVVGTFTTNVGRLNRELLLDSDSEVSQNTLVGTGNTIAGGVFSTLIGRGQVHTGRRPDGSDAGVAFMIGSGNVGTGDDLFMGGRANRVGEKRGEGFRGPVDDAFVIGYDNYIIGHDTFVMGHTNDIDGTGAEVFGNRNYVDSEATDAEIFGNDNRFLSGATGSGVFGHDNTLGVNAIDSFILGERNFAGDSDVLIMGQRNRVTSTGAVAIGLDNLVTGPESFAFGDNNESHGNQSVVIIGSRNITDSDGFRTINIGYDNYVGNEANLAIGESIRLYGRGDVFGHGTIGDSDWVQVLVPGPDGGLLEYNSSNLLLGAGEGTTATSGFSSIENNVGGAFVLGSNSHVRQRSDSEAATTVFNTYLLGNQVQSNMSHAVVIGHGINLWHDSDVAAQVRIGGNVGNPLDVTSYQRIMKDPFMANREVYDHELTSLQYVDSEVNRARRYLANEIADAEEYAATHVGRVPLTQTGEAYSDVTLRAWEYDSEHMVFHTYAADSEKWSRLLGQIYAGQQNDQDAGFDFRAKTWNLLTGFTVSPRFYVEGAFDKTALIFDSDSDRITFQQSTLATRTPTTICIQDDTIDGCSLYRGPLVQHTQTQLLDGVIYPETGRTIYENFSSFGEKDHQFDAASAGDYLRVVADANDNVTLDYRSFDDDAQTALEPRLQGIVAGVDSDLREQVGYIETAIEFTQRIEAADVGSLIDLSNNHLLGIPVDSEFLTDFATNTAGGPGANDRPFVDGTGNLFGITINGSFGDINTAFDSVVNLNPADSEMPIWTRWNFQLQTLEKIAVIIPMSFGKRVFSSETNSSALLVQFLINPALRAQADGGLLIQDIGPSPDSPTENRIKILMVKRDAFGGSPNTPIRWYRERTQDSELAPIPGGNASLNTTGTIPSTELSAMRFLGVDMARAVHDSDSDLAFDLSLFDSDGRSIVRDYRLDGGAPLYFKQRISTENYPGHFWQLQTEGTEGRVRLVDLDDVIRGGPGVNIDSEDSGLTTTIGLDDTYWTTRDYVDSDVRDQLRAEILAGDQHNDSDLNAVESRLTGSINAVQAREAIEIRAAEYGATGTRNVRSIAASDSDVFVRFLTLEDFNTFRNSVNFEFNQSEFVDLYDSEIQMQYVFRAVEMVNGVPQARGHTILQPFRNRPLDFTEFTELNLTMTVRGLGGATLDSNAIPLAPTFIDSDAALLEMQGIQQQPGRSPLLITNWSFSNFLRPTPYDYEVWPNYRDIMYGQRENLRWGSITDVVEVGTGLTFTQQSRFDSDKALLGIDFNEVNAQMDITNRFDEMVAYTVKDSEDYSNRLSYDSDLTFWVGKRRTDRVTPTYFIQRSVVNENTGAVTNTFASWDGRPLGEGYSFIFRTLVGNDYSIIIPDLQVHTLDEFHDALIADSETLEIVGPPPANLDFGHWSTGDVIYDSESGELRVTGENIYDTNGLPYDGGWTGTGLDDKNYTLEGGDPVVNLKARTYGATVPKT